jgi:Domain of unknown function (DUF1996)
MRKLLVSVVIVAIVASLSALAVPSAQAGSPRWGVSCGPIHHSLPDDPIVSPGQEGASHMHDFIGNVSTNADSTYASLQASTSVCLTSGDEAAYWVPSLSNGPDVNAVNVIAYYLLGRHDAGDLVPFPADLRIIAGDSMAQGPQPLTVVAWSCGAMGTKVQDPNTLTCGDPNKPLFSHIFFPDCWDGLHTDSVDHKSHMAYTNTQGDCPEGFERKVPLLHLQLRYPLTGQFLISLSSGTRWTQHADFLNAWNQDRLQELVTDCLNAGIDCGVDPP